MVIVWAFYLDAHSFDLGFWLKYFASFAWLLGRGYCIAYYLKIISFFFVKFSPSLILCIPRAILLRNLPQLLQTHILRSSPKVQ